MCGRYALTTPPEVLAALLHLRWLRYEAVGRYNIAPTQTVAAARTGMDGERELVAMRWGLIPSWAKDRAIGSRLINARSESAESKPAFRHSFWKKRCVIPASGFYEWKPLEGGRRKQPYYITPHSGDVLVMAGLWESWTDPQTAEVIESCSILTTNANAALRDLHDRMPVVLDEAAWNLWLDPEIEEIDRLKAVLRPAPDEWLTMRPVSSRVNSPRIDDASLIDEEPRPDDEPSPAKGSARRKRSEETGGLFD